jgi:phenylacetate-CoA ligase
MGARELWDSALLMADFKLNQWKGPGELEEIQERKLRALLSHAARSVPFYRKRLEGLGAAGLDSLREIPATEKGHVRADPLSFVSAPCREKPLSSIYTSGSTGSPLRIYFDRADGIYGAALRYHSITECGFGPADHLVNIMHSRLQPLPMQFIYRLSQLRPFDDEETAMGAIRSLSPDVLLTYPSKLAILADMNLRAARRLGIRTVISASESLAPSTRRLARESFGCDLRNYYGMNESWAIAWECGNGSMHVNSDSVIVEILDARGDPLPPGRKGEIAITSLWRYSMPFIRYRTGDSGSIGAKCACGRGLPVLKELEGRCNDSIVLPGGRRYPALNLMRAMRTFTQILQYQLVQESPYGIRALVVAARPLAIAEKEAIRSGLSSLLPPEISVEIEETGRIIREKSGKLKSVVCRVKGGEGA